MRKSLFLIILLLGCSVVASAQTSRLQTREAEWKSYVLPQTNFARQVTPEKELLFRVPADWKQETPELTFTGPHSARIIVNINKIPDGYPFQQYFASVLKGIRDLPGAADSTLTRKIQFQDLEAREICLDIPDEEGEMYRRILWTTVSGPLAISFHFQVPTAHAAETEPYFKAVVQSVIFLTIDYPAFETIRASAIKTPAPGPVHEIEDIVASLNQATANREAAITKLASLFSSHTDVAVDLLLDRRPLIRAAAVRALAQTNNSALAPLLWKMVDDEELLVAEAAARSVANSPDVVAQTLQKSLGGLNTKILARIWPFMTKDKRNEMLEKIFSQTASRPAPPKQARVPAQKPEVKVRVTELSPVKPGVPVAAIVIADAHNVSVQMGALTLLTNIPPDEFKLPLARIMASNYDDLIAIGLEVAHHRGESLPLEPLFKLVASTNENVSKRAALNLGYTAGIADISRIESLISKESSSARKDVKDELTTTIKRIRFRHELSGAKTATELREIVRKALTDSALADFAWRYDCEAKVSGCAPSGSGLKNDFAVKPFGENLFPNKVQHYTAIPNPGQAVQKFYETLNGLQLETPRAQANLVLMMGVIRQNLLRTVSAPIDADTLIEYAGIDPKSPIALTAWTADGAPDAMSIAERRAIVLRVKDRARFERTVEQFQDTFGSFTDLTTYVGASTRAIAALPALLTFSVQMAHSFDQKGPTSRPMLKYSFSHEQDWNGLRIKTIEHRWVNNDSTVAGAVTHMAFVGDAVILTSDLATLRELLANVNNQIERQFLADNQAYRRAVQSSGDIIYFSDLEAVLAGMGTTSKDADLKINESGSLNIGSASWENNHRLEFEESDWAKPLLPFDPKDFSAPRELLSASTIAYYLMKVDAVTFWPSKLRTGFVGDYLPAACVWSIDFEKEVLPELGPECGAAVLELPNLDFSGGTWAAFCKLKTNKLADALTGGKLFTGVGPVNEPVEVKAGTSSYFVTTRAGFLIFSNTAKGIALLDGKTNLAATRDYSRAVEKVPGGIVAFGGYNLEAAIAAVNKRQLQGVQAEIAGILSSIASAFHSQNFFATATAGTIEGRSSVAMDREGRYPIADFSLLPRGKNITFVALEAGGVPITDQKRLSSISVRIRAKAPGPIDNIKDDIKTAEQSVEQKSPKELLVSVAARRPTPDKAFQLPVKDPQFAEFLKATREIAVNDQNVITQARQIAGDDRDAWSVARKLADWTYQNLEWRLVASASAGETLATREADCTEFSQLFVAMARSLGLPSRMVSGLAYSGDSFGGHAWVEVWVGKWIELDPTWGTHFVDATHIRNNSNSLSTSAALNLIELEVIETKRSVSEFQKSSRALAQHLLKAIPLGDESEIEATLDLPILTNELLGADAWAKMNDSEREQMWSAYRRLLNEIISAYGPSDYEQGKLRLLHMEENGNVANLTCLLAPSDTYLKLRLVRRNEIWYLAEIVQGDTTLRTIYETFQPTIASVEKVRSGQKPSPIALTDYGRVVLLLEKDVTKALTVAEAALKSKPDDLGLRYLKAVALENLDKDEEADKLLRKLSDENFPTAIYKLADRLTESEEASEMKEGIALYERYVTLEPYDSRVQHDLAITYDLADDLVKAEAAYRKVVELNPTDVDGYVNLIVFLAQHDQLSEVRPVLIAADKNKDTDLDVLGEAAKNLYFDSESSAAENLITSEPARLKTSMRANFYRGRILFDQGKYAAALNALNISAQLDKTSPSPHLIIAQVHRKQSRWNAALKAAQHAIGLDEEDSEGHYQKACALARLGRLKEAMTSLEKAVELDPDQSRYAAEEADLKPLASLPAFKKLLPEPQKP